MMIRQLCLLIIFISLSSCNHPEGKKYERNQGSKKEFKSTNDEISVNQNVLQMELQNGVRYVWIEINGIRLRL